jgi:hypothetical protein
LTNFARPFGTFIDPLKTLPHNLKRGKASINNTTRVVGGISSSRASSKTLAFISPLMDLKLERTINAKNKKNLQF